MDPRFAPAWIAFAHAFSFEGEHEHAVTAYSTCARLYTGSHLPLMFLGMEHIILSNKQQAEDTLAAAQHMCDGDPLLYNERGVMAFSNEEYVPSPDCYYHLLTEGASYETAVTLFQGAIDLAKIVQASQKSWIPTYLNLGTALRKLGYTASPRYSLPRL